MRTYAFRDSTYYLMLLLFLALAQGRHGVSFLPRSDRFSPGHFVFWLFFFFSILHLRFSCFCFGPFSSFSHILSSG